MLPKLMANAGYLARDKDLITRSEDSVTGAPSLAHPYISSERQHAQYDLGLTWSMLDFGLGYVSAKQQADRVGIAAERRRKAMHTLVQDVRSAFWRTVSAQKLRNEVRNVIAVAEAALADARKAEEERVRSPLDSLRYQRQLLENLRLLESIEQELSSGRIELANLINAPLGVEFDVQEPSQAMDAGLLEVPVAKLEEVAVAQNADLREQFYNSRIATEEVRRTMLRLFPNLSFNYDVRKDTDRFLINDRWQDAGVHLSYNLLNLFTAPAQKRFAEAGVQLADQRRIATQMAVLTQVHLSRLSYQVAWRQFQRADAIWQADAKIAEHMKNREAAEAQSKLEQVANQTTAILSQLRRYQSLAQLQSASSKLQATLGMEPVIGSTSELSLPQLTSQVASGTRGWEAQLTGQGNQ
jgi:outer membrane protein TolC